jgi:transcriptional regulator with XRE-family HTH domain
MRKTAFAERLERIMMERNLSRSDVARLIWGTMTDERGYTVARNRQVLGKYLSGEVEPRMSTKRRMAEVLSVPMAALDPSSDPLDRPGSGIYVEPVDAVRSRIQVNMVAPNDVVRQVVVLLSRYAV